MATTGVKSMAIQGDASPDVLALQELVEELRTRYRAAESRHSDELMQLSYAFSHDLREPLRVVNTYVQLLLARCDGKLDHEEREFMGYIREATARMDRLLADLISYAYQLRSVEKPVVPVDSETVLDGVLLSLEGEIRESRAEITHGSLSPAMLVFSDLEQILRQLLVNSIKFRSTSCPLIRVATTETADETVFAVQDNGIGIDAVYHQEIFTPFRRLNGHEYPGSGIGLAICNRILERYNGRIWVESKPGGGAIFRFTVPR